MHALDRHFRAFWNGNNIFGTNVGLELWFGHTGMDIVRPDHERISRPTMPMRFHDSRATRISGVSVQRSLRGSTKSVRSDDSYRIRPDIVLHPDLLCLQPRVRSAGLRGATLTFLVRFHILPVFFWGTTSEDSILPVILRCGRFSDARRHWWTTPNDDNTGVRMERHGL